MDKNLARKNLITALIVSAIMLAMFALTFVAALVYTAG
jgi:NADH:ubiquinone oxidoreductase subunit K